MKQLIILSISLLSLFASCTKTPTTSPTTNETTAQKLQHKWNLVSLVDIQYVGSSTTIIDTTISYGINGDYFDLRDNDTAYMRFAGDYDTLPYTLINDKLLRLGQDDLTINILTSTDLKLTYYGRETNPVNNWDNVITLKR